MDTNTFSYVGFIFFYFTDISFYYKLADRITQTRTSDQKIFFIELGKILNILCLS